MSFLCSLFNFLPFCSPAFASSFSPICLFSIFSLYLFSLTSFPLTRLGAAEKQPWCEEPANVAAHTQQLKTSNNNAKQWACNKSGIWAETLRSRRLTVAFILELISVSGGLRRKQTGLDNCCILLLVLQICNVSGVSPLPRELKWPGFLLYKQHSSHVWSQGKLVEIIFSSP